MTQKTTMEQVAQWARQGDQQLLQDWLRADNDPNGYTRDGWTPLLWACARGRAELVEIMLRNHLCPARTDLAHQKSGALCIHMAGHSGSVDTVQVLLTHSPQLLNAVWDLNGHTALLQAVFYGHLPLVQYLVEQGADTAITTARGLGPMELATQFQNHAAQEVLRPFDKPASDKAQYYAQYLQRIAPQIPPQEKEAQALADHLVQTIEAGIRAALQGSDSAVVDTLELVHNLVEVQGAEVNRLGGALQQPPLIVTVTGNNGLPAVQAVADLRNSLAEYLLEKGADPTHHEEHPMGAQTIIRAAVFNHLHILKCCAKYITAEQLRDAINEYPVVNGLTAMHDTVLRTSMAGPDRVEGYYEQTRWFVQNGARCDIEDFSGTTQRQIAERCTNPQVRQRLLAIIDGTEH